MQLNGCLAYFHLGEVSLYLQETFDANGQFYVVILRRGLSIVTGSCHCPKVERHQLPTWLADRLEAASLGLARSCSLVKGCQECLSSIVRLNITLHEWFEDEYPKFLDVLRTQQAQISSADFSSK